MCLLISKTKTFRYEWSSFRQKSCVDFRFSTRLVSEQELVMQAPKPQKKGQFLFLTEKGGGFREWKKELQQGDMLEKKMPPKNTSKLQKQVLTNIESCDGSRNHCHATSTVILTGKQSTEKALKGWGKRSFSKCSRANRNWQRKQTTEKGVKGWKEKNFSMASAKGMQEYFQMVTISSHL